MTGPAKHARTETSGTLKRLLPLVSVRASASASLRSDSFAVPSEADGDEDADRQEAVASSPEPRIMRPRGSSRGGRGGGGGGWLAALGLPEKAAMAAAIRARLWWLVVHHEVVGILCSLAISLPLAVYKYQLASSDEGALALSSFENVAQSLMDTVTNAWQAGQYTPSMIADFYITEGGIVGAADYASLTFYGGYFQAISNNFLSLIYQRVDQSSLETWRTFMLEQYGGNMGSNNSFTFFRKDSDGNSVAFDTTSASSFYILSHVNNATDYAGVLGFVADSDVLHRAPLLATVAASGMPACSNRLTLVTSDATGGQSAVLVFAPVFATGGNATGAPTSDRSSVLLAVGGVGMPVQQVLESALSGYSVDPLIDIFLLDK
ncbi:hypothetical protein HK405_009643, partial [Cladochytrium tenue]